MKNKILTSSFLALLITMWIVTITNASFYRSSHENNQVHKTVINKLIDWETLTSEEKITLEEIKEYRNNREKLRAERQAQKEELSSIFEKIKIWEILTSEEETKLNEFKEKFWRNMKWHHWVKWMWMWMNCME